MFVLHLVAWLDSAKKDMGDLLWGYFHIVGWTFKYDHGLLLKVQRLSRIRQCLLQRSYSINTLYVRKKIVMSIWPVKDIYIVGQRLQAFSHWVRILTFVFWVALILAVREGGVNTLLGVRSDSHGKQQDMKRAHQKSTKLHNLSHSPKI